MTLPTNSSFSSIEERTFANCSSLTEITIPNTVRSIKTGAFSNSGLTSIFIPQKVRELDNRVFEGCQNLSSFEVDPDNTWFDSRENCNGIIETATNRLILGGKDTKIPLSVNEIWIGAFRYRSGLRSFEIPNSVISIANFAFGNCTDLQKITIPNSVKYLDWAIFRGCTGLTDIISYIEHPDQLSNMGVDIFGGVPKSTCRLHVPVGSLGTYRTTEQWKDFVHIYKHNFDCLSDVNLDGEVNIADINSVIDAIMQQNGEYNSLQDVNLDGEVNIADVNAIINSILGSQ